jgi:hypothetical protein
MAEKYAKGERAYLDAVRIDRSERAITTRVEI